MTSGAHDDGELGEVFLKLGKQGSTLAGVMDAFSIAVSIGLQYGVPLETYVSKFTNLRFEPAGLTDDPDVRMASRSWTTSSAAWPSTTSPSSSAPGLGIYSAEERQRYLETGSYEPIEETGSAAELHRRPARTQGTHVGRACRDQWSIDVEVVETEDDLTQGRARPQGGPHLRRAPGEDHRHRRRLPALLHLRHQDAPRRLLLRLRRLRQHQRLQLM